MRIAILGSVALPVPPPAQGGTEWIAYYQAKGLAEKGHRVILFAARGSKREEKYELVEVGKGDTVTGSNLNKSSVILGTNEVRTPESNPVDPGLKDSGRADACQNDDFIESSRPLRKENVYLGDVIEQLIARKDGYDLILNNMRGEAVFLPVAKYLNKPFVNIMHLPLFPELADSFRNYKTHIITISNAQRKGFDGLNYLATIYNCVDTGKFLPTDNNYNGYNRYKDDYLLMMGTIGRHKNQAGAIRVAKACRMKLILAGKIRDQDYFEEIKKDIDGEQIKYLGELSYKDKLKLYQNAKVFIFPILWEEPFGLVMIEAMACGIPVVAYNNGAIPEVVVTGKTGFVVESNSEKDMISAVKNINLIKREDCRKYVVESFSIEKIVEDYKKALLSIENPGSS